MLGRGEAGQEGLQREPQLHRGSRDCALPSAPTGPPVATCALSLSLSLRSWRERGEEAVAPQEPYVNPGVGWVGGEGDEKKGK